jgi:AraC-like DNA-binding protein
VSAGDVLIHGRYEAHQNAFGSAGADILNLPCASDMAGMACRVADPDIIVRIAERDPHEAMAAVLEGLLPGPDSQMDWPDLLAGALERDEVSSLATWADEAGLLPASVSRGFKVAYGVSPQRFRADRRACRAVRALTASPRPLAFLAAELGYADQAHMCREVLRLTGATPARWRASRDKCVQEHVHPAC